VESTFITGALEFLQDELRRIEGIEVGELDLDADISDLGIESVTLLELVSALEDRYTIEVPDDELTTLSTLRDVVELTHRQIAAKPA
jgi:acyl carrier protein